MTIWRLRTGTIDLAEPRVMGVVNITPDSFSDGGHHADPDTAISHALRLVAEGADIIDVGGESTRPGAQAVDIDDELARTIPVITELASKGVVVSVDTMKPEVARVALESGAEIVNDVSGARAPEMRRVVSDFGSGLVVMHMQGEPRTMQDNPTYDDVVEDVARYLSDRAELCVTEGIPTDRIVVDPGFGFGKTVSHNLALLERLGHFTGLGYPVMVGISRKGFLGQVADLKDAAARDPLSAVSSALAVERGASVVRVHDVAGSVAATRLVAAMVRAGSQEEQF